MSKPRIIHLPVIGEQELGYISVIENSRLPFKIKRVYWTYHTPENVERGFHAHLELEQIIVAMNGTITFMLENIKGEKSTFILDSPSKGLFIPKLHWRNIRFTNNAVLMCIASEEYLESDYIRNYDDFKQMQNKAKNK
jgi:dTDP-4-dehydrorhamnose 3,5-epimerase-like enzyme